MESAESIKFVVAERSQTELDSLDMYTKLAKELESEKKRSESQMQEDLQNYETKLESNLGNEDSELEANLNKIQKEYEEIEEKDEEYYNNQLEEFKTQLTAKYEKELFEVEREKSLRASKVESLL